MIHYLGLYKDPYRVSIVSEYLCEHVHSIRPRITSMVKVEGILSVPLVRRWPHSWQNDYVKDSPAWLVQSQIQPKRVGKYRCTIDDVVSRM
jgi:hypothetical protein